MFSLFGAAQTPFDLQIEKATSSLLPAGTPLDLHLSLEISDQIRSKAVPAKTAMLSLKKRVGEKNGNVVILTLELIDTLIKNSGHHFLIEVASREFVDNLVSIFRIPTSNHDVRTLGLKLFQQWALTFKSSGKSELSYLPEVYEELKREGLPFPPPPSTPLPSTLLETSIAPEWVDSDVCLRCRTPFTFTNRKHHCRNCGKVFDQQCSSHTMPLPWFGVTEEVRVCDGCWGKTKGPAASGPKPPVPEKSLRMDSDLARAIAMSLEEANARSGTNRPGFIAASDQGRKGGEGVVDGEDEDLRAAIEASLAEMRVAEAATAAAPASSGDEKVRESHDLTAREMDAILTFNQTIEQASRMGERDLSRYPHAHELWSNAEGLRGKLMYNLDDRARKLEMLGQMQNKISEAVNLYDRLLNEGVAQSRLRQQQQQQQRYSGYSQPSPYAQYDQPNGSSMYPQQPQYHQWATPPQQQQQQWGAPPQSHMYPTAPSPQSQPVYQLYPSSAPYTPQNEQQQPYTQLTSPAPSSSLNPSAPTFQPQQSYPQQPRAYSQAPVSPVSRTSSMPYPIAGEPYSASSAPPQQQHQASYQPQPQHPEQQATSWGPPSSEPPKYTWDAQRQEWVVEAVGESSQQAWQNQQQQQEASAPPAEPPQQHQQSYAAAAPPLHEQQQQQQLGASSAAASAPPLDESPQHQALHQYHSQPQPSSPPTSPSALRNATYHQQLQLQAQTNGYHPSSAYPQVPNTIVPTGGFPDVPTDAFGEMGLKEVRGQEPKAEPEKEVELISF